jgi:hypothetical protein
MLALFVNVMTTSERLTMPSSKPSVKQLKGHSRALVAVSNALLEDEKRPRALCSRLVLVVL